MNACTCLRRSHVTGERMCTAGAYPEDGNWERFCSQCRDGAERDEERKSDCERDEHEQPR